MHTILFASRKGGAGKTTLAAHVAVEAERRGAGPVALIDCDPMAGLAGWWNEREAEAPVFAEVGEGGLARTLHALEGQGVRLVVIDTPPAANQSLAAMIAVSSLVVVPVVPSPHDLRAIGQTLNMIEAEGKPMVFVVNNASTNGRLTNLAYAALSEHGVVSPVAIRTRQDYRSSMIKGKTASEIDGKSKSAAEISELWHYLAGRLAKGQAHAAAAVA